ncbi:hypothetical protein B0T24DRAFT_669249 [Lasiosphaeria ovina]|uniref:Uncharacterized protein n=1 Tax=Lasiosphaeria ovina TaxID=92902 RepID=A0AAE0JYN5_9PEZI|nr:hypothetical protein B0T24DRAFT_669249 [Lasiosphaeria ovina]
MEANQPCPPLPIPLISTLLTLPHREAEEADKPLTESYFDASQGPPSSDTMSERCDQPLLGLRLKKGALVIAKNGFRQAGGYVNYVSEPGNSHVTLGLPFDKDRGNVLSVRTI